MELIINTILFLGVLCFVYFWQIRRERAEEKRFREFVISVKSKNIDEYNLSIPEDQKIEELPESPYQDIQDVAPDKLLQAIKKEDEDN